MKRKEGLHHVRDEGGGGVLGSVPGSEGADFLGRAINSFLQPPVKECGSEQAREGVQAGGRKEAFFSLSLSLPSFSALPSSRRQVINRVFGSHYEMPNMQACVSKTTGK